MAGIGCYLLDFSFSALSTASTKETITSGGKARDRASLEEGTSESGDKEERKPQRIISI